MKRASVCFDKPVRPMKPVHGVNNGPKTRLFSIDMSKYFVEAGIPYARLHDTEYPYGSGHFVDIPCIFPDFSADPDDPGSYDFVLTDQYLQAIVNTGTKVFYRLGVSIEHASKKYNIFPPKDNERWARICAGIIRHYNEGWADGCYYGIRYWEIWNEPENPPMWQGTRDEYFRLYVTTANYLKNRFPDIKVGGYAGCGFYALNRPNPTEFYQSFITYFTDFLDYVSAPETRAPLDFYSWHLYTDSVAEMVGHAEYVRKTLDQHGFAATESIINEWNYVKAGPGLFERMTGMEAASFVSGVLSALQQTSVDMGNYYDAQPNMRYCGIFNYVGPNKPYYAFKAFNSLFRLKNEVYTACDRKNTWLCAASSATEAAVVLTSCKGKQENILLEMCGLTGDSGVEAEFYVLDETCNLELQRCELFFAHTLKAVVRLDKDAVVLVKLRVKTGK